MTSFLGIHVAVSKGGSMTVPLFKDYLSEVIGKRNGAIFNPSTVLLMDQAASHKVDELSNLPNTEALLIPAGCTPLVQPLDVTLNKPFKTRMREQWKKWITLPEGEQNFTKKGKRQRVSAKQCFNPFLYIDFGVMLPLLNFLGDNYTPVINHLFLERFHKC